MSDPIWDEIIEKIDQLVMCAVEADEADFSTIIKVHDEIMEVVGILSDTPSYPIVFQIGQKAAEVAMRIVLQESEDSGYDLNTVIESCSAMQCMVREIINDQDPSSIQIPDGLDLEQNSAMEFDAPQEEKEEVLLPKETVLTDEISHETMSSDKIPLIEQSRVIFKLPKDNINPSHISAFLSDIHDLIEVAESSILLLENDPKDHESIESLLSVFHTIKGNAGILQIQEMVDVAHISETLLEKVDLLTPEAANLLFGAIDSFKEIEQSLDTYLKTTTFGKITNPQKLIEEFTSFLGELEQDAHTEESCQEPKRERDTDSYLYDSIIGVDTGYAPTITENIEVPYIKGEKTHSSSELIDVQDILKSLDGHTELGAELGVAENFDIGQNEIIQNLDQTQSISAVTKIKIKDLDILVDTVGELLISYSMIENDPFISGIQNINSQKKINLCRKLIQTLQSTTLSVRMTPIKPLFQTMKRLGRDLSRRLGKDVLIHVSGEHTEIDRSLVDSLQEPLLHMMRNAVDHGIEGIQERINIGKPEVAHIYLRAYHNMGNVMIEIEDDGQGIQVEKIKKKASTINTGLNSERTNWESLIFQSGFSTKETVSEISGRGMGLDIVKRRIENVQGRIDIESKEGEGTKFIIVLPLTLAMLDGVAIRVQNNTYIMTTNEIKEFIHVGSHKITTIINGGDVIGYKEKNIPVVYVGKIIDKSHYKKDDSEKLGVIVTYKNEDYCLVVDEVLKQQQIVIKSMGSKFKNLVGISAATILGDGSIAYILDIQNILVQYLNVQYNQAN